MDSLLLELGWRFSTLRSCKFLGGSCGTEGRVPVPGSLGISFVFEYLLSVPSLKVLRLVKLGL